MHVVRSAVVAALAVALVTPLVPAQTAAGLRVVDITPPDARRPAEVSVAINPTNRDHAIAVMLQAGAPGEPRVSNWSYASHDGGMTWKPVAAHNSGARPQGDDAVVFGADGTAFHSYIAFDGIRVERPERAFSGIFVRSTKDGLSWNPPVAVVDHINTAIPFEDKPWIGVDRSPASPHRGNVYVAWTRFDVYGSENPAHRSRIMFSRSRDDGRTFSVPIEISDETGNALDSDDTVEGVVPVTAPNGDVYVAWAGPKGLYFDRSTDGGWTFGNDTVISAMPGGWDLPVPGIERHNGMPITAVDLSQSAHRGTVYVNWIDQRNGDPDVFVIASKDGGRTWGTPVRVNDDANGHAQLFTWMAIDPVDGSVNVVFHDRRNQPGTMTGVTVARSSDGGKHFINMPLPVPAFDCCAKSAFFGDYNAIDAYGGRVIAAFPILTATGQQKVQAAVAQFHQGTVHLQ